MSLENIYSVLNKVLKDKVFYGTNVYDNDDNASMPFIVYQETNKRVGNYADNKPLWYKCSIQITLVTKKKDVTLESKLEAKLLNAGFAFSLHSEYRNEDRSLNRVYEIYMEEIKNV